MKVAFVSLIAYDDLNRVIIHAHPNDPDFYDQEILVSHHDPVQKWCKALIEQRIEIEFWYLSYLSKAAKYFHHQFGHKMLRIHACDLRSLMTRFFSMPLSWRLLRELRDQAVTHVILLNYLLNPKILVDMADIVIWHCRRRGIKVLPVYGGGSIEEYGFCKKKIKASFLRKSSGLLCQNRTELDAMLGRHRFPREKAFLFSNPLDLEHFQRMERADAVQALSLDGDSRYILYIGRLVHTKGAGHLIQIMPELLREFPRLVLLVIGTGAAEGEWRRSVDERGLSGHVRFLGYQENKRLHYFYNAAEALVLPSHSEGVPNVILEAIACDTPVIATAVGGIPHVLAGGLGILVPPLDEPALAEAIATVLKKRFVPDQEQRNRLLAEINMRTKGAELAKILSQV